MPSELRTSSGKGFRPPVIQKSGRRPASLSDFLAQLTERFANVPVESVDTKIVEALRHIVAFLDVDRCSLARSSAGGELLVVSSYAAPGTTPTPVGDIRARLPWYVGELMHGRAVRISHLDDLPSDATAERAYISASGMKSHLGIPITVGGMPLCALGVATFSRQIDFSQEFVNSLLLFGKVLVNALARRESECRLRRMEAELSHITRVATVGQLATSIAHEINQPLCAIVSNAQAAVRLLDQRTPPLEEIRAALSDITADGKRAGDIVSRSHRLLKPRDLSFQPLSINNVIHDVHALLRSDIVIRRVRVALDLQQDLPEITGDFVQLHQVVLNLLINAADATAVVFDRERTVTVRSYRTEDRVHVLVSDNGVGLSAEVTARMFEPFFTTKPSGLGMGLAINRTIVEAHRGRIWAESNSDYGATVGFSIPLNWKQG